MDQPLVFDTSGWTGQYNMNHVSALQPIIPNASGWTGQINLLPNGNISQSGSTVYDYFQWNGQLDTMSNIPLMGASATHWVPQWPEFSV